MKIKVWFKSVLDDPIGFLAEKIVFNEFHSKLAR